MATEIQSWQILDGQLSAMDETMAGAGHWEHHLEQWIQTNPAILGEDIRVIGSQVLTRSGPMDFLAIDRSGNLVVVELKRGALPREALAQAIDYASDVASWDTDRIGELCLTYRGKTLEDFLIEGFGEFDVEEVSINEGQRIILVGFSIEDSLGRMIEWLSDQYDISINAVILHYMKTKSGDECLSRTSIIPEAVEIEKSRKKKVKLALSDEPGHYGDEALRQKFSKFLSSPQPSAIRVREILLPLCLKIGTVTREQLKRAIIDAKVADDEFRAGLLITSISNLLGFLKRDYLRQVIGYDRDPIKSWEKTNFRVRPECKQMVEELLKNSDS